MSDVASERAGSLAEFSKQQRAGVSGKSEAYVAIERANEQTENLRTTSVEARASLKHLDITLVKTVVCRVHEEICH